MPEPVESRLDESAQDKPLPFRDGDGRTADLRASFTPPHEPVVANDEMRFMLGTACRLLWQVAALTSGVLETVRTADVRAICADDLPLSYGCIDGDGRRAPDTSISAAEADKPAPKRPERDHRKEPRGRVHPLLMLVRLGVQASRLLRQIGGGTHPGLQNILTVDQKLDLHSDKSRLAWERLDRRGLYHI